MRFLADTNIDFVGKRKGAMVVSAILLAVGPE